MDVEVWADVRYLLGKGFSWLHLSVEEEISRQSQSPAFVTSFLWLLYQNIVPLSSKHIDYTNTVICYLHKIIIQIIPYTNKIIYEVPSLVIVLGLVETRNEGKYRRCCQGAESREANSHLHSQR